MTEIEFEFSRCKQIIELEQGRRMSPEETQIAKAVFYFAKGIELKNGLDSGNKE